MFLKLHRWEMANLLALLYVMCFCHFPIRCPGSGVVLDCIDSLSLTVLSYLSMTVSVSLLPKGWQLSCRSF